MGGGAIVITAELAAELALDEEEELLDDELLDEEDELELLDDELEELVEAVVVHVAGQLAVLVLD